MSDRIDNPGVALLIELENVFRSQRICQELYDDMKDSICESFGLKNLPMPGHDEYTAALKTDIEVETYYENLSLNLLDKRLLDNNRYILETSLEVLHGIKAWYEKSGSENDAYYMDKAEQLYYASNEAEPLSPKSWVQGILISIHYMHKPISQNFTEPILDATFYQNSVTAYDYANENLTDDDFDAEFNFKKIVDISMLRILSLAYKFKIKAKMKTVTHGDLAEIRNIVESFQLLAPYYENKRKAKKANELINFLASTYHL